MSPELAAKLFGIKKLLLYPAKYSQVVVSNIDAKSTFNRLVGPKYLNKIFL